MKKIIAKIQLKLENRKARRCKKVFFKNMKRKEKAKAKANYLNKIIQIEATKSVKQTNKQNKAKENIDKLIE